MSALRATADVLVVSWVLKHRGVAALAKRRPVRPSIRDADAARAVSAAVDAAFGMIPISPTCLRRSMVLARELWRLGLEATTHVGVRRNDERIEAHAWVQVGDEVVNDDPDVTDRYTQLLEARWDALVPILQ